MKRESYIQLKRWKDSTYRKPLVVMGARQVGKTYLVKEFGQKEYETFACINFEDDPDADTLFEGRFDISRLKTRIEAYLGVKVKEGSTLIFLDEIQGASNALRCLKYFNEKANQYHVVAAGSLLGLKFSPRMSFPVGQVNLLNLYPLSFVEFLSGIKKENLKKIIEDHQDFEQIPAPFHHELIELLKIYYYIGGMPEVVFQYSQTQDLSLVRNTQTEILKTFQLDISKHAPINDVLKINQIWESIPVQLSRENKKFTFSTVKKSARAREYERALQWLVDAGLIYKSFNISRPGLPMEAYKIDSAFKVFMLDVGLLGACVRTTADMVVKQSDLFTHFRGALVENFVAQELIVKGQENLYYWTSKGTAEVDFVISIGEKILPLEVKSGRMRQGKSLHVYAEKFKPQTISQTTLDNFTVNRGISHYPLYAMSLFPKV